MKVTKILCGAIVFFSMNTLIAQTWLELKEQGANFNQIQAAFSRENSGKIKKFKRELVEEANGKAAKSGKFEREMEGMIHYYRWAAFVEPRVQEANGEMAVMNEGMMRAIAKKSGEIQTRAANWTLVGPKSIPTNGGNGRINAVRVHPTDANTLFACSPAGGLWKSSNGGGSWTAVSDAISALGCTDVAFDPTNPNILYLLTGDGEAGDVFTLGVYKSTDGGNSWLPTGLVFNLSNSKILSKILVHPTNGNTIIVGGSAGIYRSTDGGTTWSQRSTSSVRDLEFKPSDPSVIYAGGYGTSAGFWRSVDGGATWSKPTTLMTTGVQRVAVAVSPANADYVYALAATTTYYGFEGLYLSTDGGATFTKKSSTPNILGWYSGTATQADATDGQGWYDLSLAVSPSDINTLFTGGVNIWKSTTGGTSWSKMSAWDAPNSATNYTHADIHDLCFKGTDLYVGCDGGVFKTTNSGASWSDLSSNLSIAQLYGLGLSATSETTILSGHQDNGTTLTTNGTSWSEVNGGDGMLCFIDRTNNNNLFSSIYYGNLYRSTNGGGGFSKIYTVTGGGWVTPWLQDPVTATTLYAGGTNVVKSINSGTAWTTISAFSGVGTLVSLDVAKTNNQLIVAASKTKVMKTTNGGTSWTDITAGLPANPTIQNIHIDVNDANKIYVALASYTGNSAFLSINGGSTWTNISAGMPQIPVNCFVTQSNAGGVVYCGNDLGVCFSSNSGTSWESFTNGMPGVPVMDLEIFYPTGRLRAATYGRGVWDSNLNGFNQAPSVSITSPTNNAVFTAPTTITIEASAADSDGSIAKVEFYNGTTLLGTALTVPYSFLWNSVAVGSYVITAKAYDNANATTTSTAINISVSIANDAGITAIAKPNGAVGASETPSVTLKNFGSATLTSVSILSKVDNGAEITYNWTGSLASNATTNVNLQNITGYTTGNHTFTARTENPNSATDGNAANDATVSNFTYSTAPLCSNINEPSDNSPTTATALVAGAPISSQIGTTTDNDYYKITTTSALPKLKLTLSNLPANYILYLYSAKNNGTIGSILATSDNAGTLDETILYNTASIGRTYFVRIRGASSAFSTTNCYTLTANTSSTSFIRPLLENTTLFEDDENLTVYPNPADDNVTIRYKVLEQGTYTLQLVDVTGKTLIRQTKQFENGENIVELDTNSIVSGLYFVKLSNETQTAVSKLLIEK